MSQTLVGYGSSSGAAADCSRRTDDWRAVVINLHHEGASTEGMGLYSVQLCDRVVASVPSLGPWQAARLLRTKRVKSKAGMFDSPTLAAVSTMEQSRCGRQKRTLRSGFESMPSTCFHKALLLYSPQRAHKRPPSPGDVIGHWLPSVAATAATHQKTTCVPPGVRNHRPVCKVQRSASTHSDASIPRITLTPGTATSCDTLLRRPPTQSATDRRSTTPFTGTAASKGLPASNVMVSRRMAATPYAPAGTLTFVGRRHGAQRSTSRSVGLHKVQGGRLDIYSRSPKNPALQLLQRLPNRPLRPRRGTLLGQMQCGIFGRTAVFPVFS